MLDTELVHRLSRRPDPTRLTMTGRLVRSEDFVRVLATPARARSPHFAVHHLASAPSRPASRLPKHTLSTELSTSVMSEPMQGVDDVTWSGLWLGTVVPKRHAKRSVTRTLMKRQIKAAWQRHAAVPDDVPDGLWVVRLRAPYPKDKFLSAASVALAGAVRAELDAMFGDMARRSPRGRSGT